MMKLGIECSQVVVEKAAKAMRGNNEKAQNGRHPETVLHAYVIIRSFLRETFIFYLFLFQTLSVYLLIWKLSICDFAPIHAVRRNKFRFMVKIS